MGGFQENQKLFCFEWKIFKELSFFLSLSVQTFQKQENKIEFIMIDKNVLNLSIFTF